MTLDELAREVERAAERLAGVAHRTPVMHSHALDALAGAPVWLKCENMQRAGAFKFRGACNAVWALDEDTAQRGVVTHSSGNHGAALALAARTRGIPAHVVVPEGAVRAKLAAIEAYGAILHRCAPTMAAREETAARVERETGATLVHPFTDPNVIAGQGTAALELLRETKALDAIVTPVGGGGLICGSALAAHGIDPRIAVLGAEPAGAADAYESLASGTRVTTLVPDTICDGLRGIVGAVNLALMREARVRIRTVTDAQTRAAMRLVFERLKIVVEPSAAIALAAVLAERDALAGRRVGIVLSGGNVDLDSLPFASSTAAR